MNLADLNKVAEAMVASGKGILAADESSGTIKKRFDAINVESTEESRRDYREMLFRAAGRRPRVIGKPQPAMALLALERTGFAPEQAVMVGDRLYTDIAGGVNAGIDTAFVLSGEGRPADLETSPAQPTWVFADIAALHRAWISEP